MEGYPQQQPDGSYQQFDYSQGNSKSPKKVITTVPLPKENVSAESSPVMTDICFKSQPPLPSPNCSPAASNDASLPPSVVPRGASYNSQSRERSNPPLPRGGNNYIAQGAAAVANMPQSVSLSGSAPYDQNSLGHPGMAPPPMHGYQAQPPMMQHIPEAPVSPNTERRQHVAAEIVSKLDQCVQARELDKATEIFEQIVQSRADRDSDYHTSRRLPELYLNFAKASLGRNSHITPLDLISSLRRSKVNPDKDFYESMMRILAHRQYFEYAIRVFEEMDKDNIKAEPVTFSCLVNFAVEMNDGVRAKIFFDALCKRQTPSIRAYMQMLRMQSKLKDADEAFRLLKDMEARGVGVDRLAINTALGACVNGNDLDKAKQLMSFAKRYHGDRLDIITFNTLLKGLALESRVEEAFELLDDMPRYQVAPNEITFNTLMDAAVRANQYERAWAALDAMRAQGFLPDKYTWSTLAKGLKRSRDKEKKRACHGLMQMIYEMKPQDAMAVQQMNLYEFV